MRNVSVLLKSTSLAISLILFGCAKPSVVADYGTYPSDYEELAKERITDKLIDPESARFRFGEPVKAYVNNGLIYGGNVVFTGYVVPVMVNAKNRMGGYTGFDEWYCLVKYKFTSDCMSGSYRESPLIHALR